MLGRRPSSATFRHEKRRAARRPCAGWDSIVIRARVIHLIRALGALKRTPRAAGASDMPAVSPETRSKKKSGPLGKGPRPGSVSVALGFPRMRGDLQSHETWSHPVTGTPPPLNRDYLYSLDHLLQGMPNDRRDPPRPAPRTAQVRRNRRDLRRDAIGGKAKKDAPGRKEKSSPVCAEKYATCERVVGSSIIATRRQSTPNPFGPPPARAFTGQRGAHPRITHRRHFRSPSEARCWGAACARLRKE